MSRILLYADPHFCTYSSVIRGRGGMFSTRIENLIDVFKFIDATAQTERVDRVICLGDMFDKPDLSAEEITALDELPGIGHHDYLIGNHEASSHDLVFNSVNAIKNSSIHIYTKPCVEYINETALVFIPYTLETNRPTVTQILDDLQVPAAKKIVILSHNDIKDTYYGNFKTTVGFSVSDIEANCDLFINAHIHNGGKIGEKILNLGSVTGINFSNDASTWIPKVAILDTDTLQLDLIDCAPALLFFKYATTNIKQVNDVIKHLSVYDKKHVVLSLKCRQSDCDAVRELLDKEQYLYSRISVDYAKENVESNLSAELGIELNIDYVEKFREFVKTKYENEEVNCKLMLEEVNNIAARG